MSRFYACILFGERDQLILLWVVRCALFCIISDHVDVTSDHKSPTLHLSECPLCEINKTFHIVYKFIWTATHYMVQNCIIRTKL